MSDSVVLFRPVGRKELDLIIEADMRAFPPRLDWQPIFYPVLNVKYATQIARDWNTKDGAVGYVTRLAVNGEFIAGYEAHQVGSKVHLEHWIPAGELADFNLNLVGPIEFIAAFRGDPPESDERALAEARALSAAAQARYVG